MCAQARGESHARQAGRKRKALLELLDQMENIVHTRGVPPPAAPGAPPGSPPPQAFELGGGPSAAPPPPAGLAAAAAAGAAQIIERCAEE